MNKAIDLGAVRARHGLTQQQLAELCSKERGSPVYQHQISTWETKRQMSRATQAMLLRVVKSLDDEATGRRPAMKVKRRQTSTAAKA